MWRTNVVRAVGLIGVASRGVMSSSASLAATSSCKMSPQISERCIGAIKAGFVADAASMGLHWIYDVTKIKELTKTSAPEFHEPPACPFYKYEPGQLSPYGAEALGVLRVMGHSFSDKPWETQAFAVEYKKYLQGYSGRLNHASKELIKAIDSGKVFPNCGADDSQANSLVKVAVAVSKFQGRDDWAQHVEDVLRVHQNNDVALKFGMAAAHIVHHILNSENATVRDSLDWAVGPLSPLDSEAKTTIETAINFGKDKSSEEAASVFGSSCSLPGAFSVCIHLLSKEVSYETAVRENILAGGDQCSRAVFLGACYGAVGGSSVIPSVWASKVADMPEIDAMVRMLVDKQSPSKL